MRSLWTGKFRGEESDNTDPLASHRKIDRLDSCSMRCHRFGRLLTPEASPSTGFMPVGVSGTLSGLVTDSAPSSVCAGGGVFIAHVVVQMCWSISMVALD